MQFVWQGRTYNTEQMTEYATGSQAMPSVYVTADGGEVFVLTLDRWTGVSIHRADGGEVRLLAELYHLPQLLKVCPE